MRRIEKLWIGAVLAGLITWIPMAQGAEHPANLPATAAAQSLMRQAQTPVPGGRQHAMLRALRHLRAPSLAPWFQKLAENPRPALRLHGLLGAAALSRHHHLALEQIAQVKDPAVVAELVGAALDDDLLDLDDAATMMNWKGLNPGVKTLIATRLVAAGRTFDPAPLRAALDSSSPGRRGLAALLLLQRGDRSMRARLDALSRSDDPSRDAVRATLLRASLRYKLDRAAPWAYAVASDPDMDRTLELLALKAAMRLGQSRAAALWSKRFAANDDPAQRLRLALVGLDVSPWMDPAVYGTMAASHEPLVAQLGRTAQAVASKQSVQEQVVALIQRGYPSATRWALSYAKDQATADDAPLIELGVIVSYGEQSGGSHERRRARGLDQAATATQALCEGSPTLAGRLLEPMLTDPQADVWQRRAILLGLVRLPGSAQTPADRKPFDVASVVRGLPDFNDPMASNLLTLLRAKEGLALSRSQGKTLGLLVQGGGELAPGLRTQAAWAYLRGGGERPGQAAGN